MCGATMRRTSPTLACAWCCVPLRLRIVVPWFEEGRLHARPAVCSIDSIAPFGHFWGRGDIDVYTVLPTIRDVDIAGISGPTSSRNTSCTGNRIQKETTRRGAEYSADERMTTTDWPSLP